MQTLPVEPVTLRTYETPPTKTEPAQIVVCFLSGRLLATVRIDTSSADPHRAAVLHAVQDFGPVNVQRTGPFFTGGPAAGGTYVVSPVTPGDRKFEGFPDE